MSSESNTLNAASTVIIHFKDTLDVLLNLAQSKTTPRATLELLSKEFSLLNDSMPDDFLKKSTIPTKTTILCDLVSTVEKTLSQPTLESLHIISDVRQASKRKQPDVEEDKAADEIIRPMKKHRLDIPHTLNIENTNLKPARLGLPNPQPPQTSSYKVCTRITIPARTPPQIKTETETIALPRLMIRIPLQKPNKPVLPAHSDGTSKKQRKPNAGERTKCTCRAVHAPVEAVNGLEHDMVPARDLRYTPNPKEQVPAPRRSARLLEKK